MCVPEYGELKRDIMEESHSSAYGMHNALKIPYNFYNNFIIYFGYKLSQTWVFPGKLINC